MTQSNLKRFGMTSAFSSSDAECITRDVEVSNGEKQLDEIWYDNRLVECTEWINGHQFKKVSFDYHL